MSVVNFQTQIADCNILIYRAEQEIAALENQIKIQELILTDYIATSTKITTKLQVVEEKIAFADRLIHAFPIGPIVDAEIVRKEKLTLKKKELELYKVIYNEVELLKKQLILARTKIKLTTFTAFIDSLQLHKANL